MALTLEDLVRNRTVSPAMAATLAYAAMERRSMLFVAIPRMAGKSTLMRATLAHAPAKTPFYQLRRSLGPQLGIPASGGDGYLVMSEIAPTGFDDYLWDSEVRTVFAALERGFSLATALHAGSIGAAFDIITRVNDVPNEQEGAIDVVVYVRSLGDWRVPNRRVVEQLWEVDSVDTDGARARLIEGWDEAADRFESAEQPQRIGATIPGQLAALKARFTAAEQA